MKTAIYQEDGVLQVVLTPESEFEQNILSLVEKKEAVEMYRGSFYECLGGWNRWQKTYDNYYGGQHDLDDRSLILVVKK